MASTTIPGTSKELDARMTAAWPAFRLAAETLSPAQLEQRTPSGWTYKEMLGHVAAWHESAARRVATYRATGRTELDADARRALYEHLGLAPARIVELVKDWDMDRFNAAVASASGLKDREAILRSLDASFERLRSVVSGLTDEQLATHTDENGQPWAVAVVEGDSYGHYPEHLAELKAATRTSS